MDKAPKKNRRRHKEYQAAIVTLLKLLATGYGLKSGFPTLPGSDKKVKQQYVQKVAAEAATTTRTDTMTTTTTINITTTRHRYQ